MTNKNANSNSIIRDESWMKLRVMNSSRPNVKQIVDRKRNLILATVVTVEKADDELTHNFLEKLKRLMKEYYAQCFLNLL